MVKYVHKLTPQRAFIVPRAERKLNFQLIMFVCIIGQFLIGNYSIYGDEDDYRKWF